MESFFNSDKNQEIYVDNTKTTMDNKKETQKSSKYRKIYKKVENGPKNRMFFVTGKNLKVTDCFPNKFSTSTAFFAVNV